MKEIHRDSQLLCDSYLAILLSRKDKELYEEVPANKLHRLLPDETKHQPK